MEADLPLALWKNFRLPQDVRPVGYNLTLTPDLENFTFDGFVNIVLQAG